MLYYFYKKRKVKDYPGIKSRLTRAFGYKSDGHFYHDWNYLLNGEFLTKKDGYIKITRKGNKEFALLTTIQIAEIVSIAFGVVFLLFWFMSFLGLSLSPQVLPAYGIFMLAMSILYHKILKDFAPELPEADGL